jgi:hypothetical protein
MVLLLLAALPGAAQSHSDTERGTAGVYFDYTRLQSLPLNLFGVGGRVGINDHKYLAFEGELAYDFGRERTSQVCFGSGCLFGVFSTDLTNTHMLHGLFGPKVQTGGRHVRLFAVAKGGFVHLGSDLKETFNGTPVFTASSSDTHGAFYPGGGVEFLKQRWGVRLEAGDEIFWSGGANHNFKLMAGPVFRF